MTILVSSSLASSSTACRSRRRWPLSLSAGIGLLLFHYGGRGDGIILAGAVDAAVGVSGDYGNLLELTDPTTSPTMMVKDDSTILTSNLNLPSSKNPTSSIVENDETTIQHNYHDDDDDNDNNGDGDDDGRNDDIVNEILAEVRKRKISESDDRNENAQLGRGGGTGNDIDLLDANHLDDDDGGDSHHTRFLGSSGHTTPHSGANSEVSHSNGEATVFSPAVPPVRTMRCVVAPNCGGSCPRVLELDEIDEEPASNAAGAGRAVGGGSDAVSAALSKTKLAMKKAATCNKRDLKNACRESKTQLLLLPEFVDRERREALGMPAPNAIVNTSVREMFDCENMAMVNKLSIRDEQVHDLCYHRAIATLCAVTSTTAMTTKNKDGKVLGTDQSSSSLMSSAIGSKAGTTFVHLASVVSVCFGVLLALVSCGTTTGRRIIFGRCPFPLSVFAPGDIRYGLSLHEMDDPVERRTGGVIVTATIGGGGSVRKLGIPNEFQKKRKLWTGEDALMIMDSFSLDIDSNDEESDGCQSTAIDSLLSSPADAFSPEESDGKLTGTVTTYMDEERGSTSCVAVPSVRSIGLSSSPTLTQLDNNGSRECAEEEACRGEASPDDEEEDVGEDL